jgi:hypothetical protein
MSENRNAAAEISIEIGPRRVVRILLIVVFAMIVVGLASQLYIELVDDPRFRLLAERFSLNREATVPTWYAISTLLVVQVERVVRSAVAGPQIGRLGLVEPIN